MDTLAHGLWGAALAPKQNKDWITKAAIFSMLPDLIWLPFMGAYLLFTKNPIPHSWADAPIWFFQIYSLAHSLVVWLTIFVLSSLILKRIQWVQLFWLLHILIDIPGHLHFTTAFLYPISTYQYHGHFSWEANPFLILSFLIPIIVISIRHIIKKSRVENNQGEKCTLKPHCILVPLRSAQVGQHSICGSLVALRFPIFRYNY